MCRPIPFTTTWSTHYTWKSYVIVLRICVIQVTAGKCSIFARSVKYSRFETLWQPCSRSGNNYRYTNVFASISGPACRAKWPSLSSDYLRVHVHVQCTRLFAPRRGVTCLMCERLILVIVASMICESVAVGINDLCCILLTMECA